MSFSKTTVEDMLVKVGRCCCICHKFCGVNIELHHIVPKSEGGEDIFENCIPLCFDCHVDVQHYNPQHPKGHKYSPAELKNHRDSWINKMQRGIGLTGNELWIDVDRKLYKTIIGMIPSGLVTSFACEYDFSGAYHSDLLDPFEEIVRESYSPEFEFLDSDLESFRADFCQTIKHFVDLLHLHTFTDNGTLFFIPDLNKDYVPEEDREQWSINKGHAKEINDAATKVCTHYQEFVRFARRKLAV